MHLLPVVECGLLGAGVVALLIPVVLRAAQKVTGLRRQELHHLQGTPVPRLGGLALASAFVAVEVMLTFFLPGQRAPVPGRMVVILSSLAMFAIGFWDDLAPVGAKRKLIAQIAVALCVSACGLGIDSLKLPFSVRILELHGWGVLFTVLWLVGITNLLNLIDGVDGLAGGIGMMLMGLLVYVGYQNGTFVLLTAGMTGALFAFLCFNLPPARIYLGDGGAYLIGYQIAIFSLVSSHKGTVIGALIAPLFVLALPILDASLAIVRRGLCGLPLFRPDRRHIHHRLLASGMSRRQVVLFGYTLTLVSLAMGFVVCWSRGQYVAVLLGVLVLILLVCAGRLSFSREWFAVGRTLGSSLALRQEVAYALSLGQLLRHEGSRCASLDDLFSDFVSAASRLGFSSVRLKLADGARTWRAEPSCRRIRRLNQNLLAGHGGELELCAPICMRRHVCVNAFGPGDDRGNQACEQKPDHRKFEILSELLIENWLKAISQFAGDIREPMTFRTPPIRVFDALSPARRQRSLIALNNLGGQSSSDRRVQITPESTLDFNRGVVKNGNSQITNL